MSSGIIIQRAQALVIAATDHSLYDNLPAHCKAQVDDIAAKDPNARTQQDCVTLATLLSVAVHC